MLYEVTFSRTVAFHKTYYVLVKDGENLKEELVEELSELFYDTPDQSLDSKYLDGSRHVFEALDQTMTPDRIQKSKGI